MNNNNNQDPTTVETVPDAGQVRSGENDGLTAAGDVPSQVTGSDPETVLQEFVARFGRVKIQEIMSQVMAEPAETQEVTPKTVETQEVTPKTPAAMMSSCVDFKLRAEGPAKYDGEDPKEAEDYLVEIRSLIEAT